MKTQYRGFDIVLSGGEQWSAQIVNPATGKPWSHRATGPAGAGSAECLRQAQSLVDAFLALHGTQSA